MSTLEALYTQAPYWVWLGTAGLFVILALVTGVRSLVWPVLAAVVVATLDLMGLRMPPTAEMALFLALTTTAFILPKWMTTPHSAKVPSLDLRQRTKAGKPHEMGTVDRTSRLVGRIGRTTSEFANGVGRVWIEGAEWAAELESGEDGVPPEAPVRVTRVVGGVRLQVQGLDR